MKPLADLARAASAASDLAADSRSLDSLKRLAGSDPQKAIKSAAKQFEAVFMQMVLKSMRDATAKSGLLDSGTSELYTGMLDQQLAGTMAGNSGLAAMIERQLARFLPASPAASGTMPATTEVAPTSAGGATAPASAAQPLPSASAPQAPARDGAAPTGAGSTSRANGNIAGGISGASAPAVFVSRMWDHALAAQRATGLPAKFIVGQAALESGWGGREITGADGTRSFNLFGIKAGAGWQGRTVEATTTEYDNGVAVRKVEKFRAYNSYGEAFRDWARLLLANPRYAEVLARGTDASSFAYGLQRAGYATDPNYGAKLQKVIETAQALRDLG